MNILWHYNQLVLKCINFSHASRTWLKNHLIIIPHAYIEYFLIIWRLREWSKTGRKYLIKKLYGIRKVKFNNLKRETYLKNMQIISKISKEYHIPQHILIEKWKPEEFKKIII